ncbi:glycosyltransferase [Mucilaginibacter psychrotolerans]|nr:glycosyltransferase [Mucilaginibacter psychrotolerans]
MPDALVILSPGFAASEADTTCLPAQQAFVLALKQECPDLDIIILSFQYPFKRSEYLWNGVKVFAFGGKSRSGLYRLLTWLRVWLRLRKLHRQYSIIGLLSFWLGEAAFVGSHFARLKGLKHYSWLLGQDAKAGNKYARWIKPRGDDLIALSDALRAEYQKNYGIAPAYVIPNGVLPGSFPDTGGERDIDILGVGSLIPLKRYHLFAELIHQLKESQPNIKAVICGDGPEMQNLKNLIERLGLGDNLVLKGELPHPQVLALMQRSRVFMHTSEYEGFSTVCLEALFAGAQVVSFVKAMDAQIPNWHVVGTSAEMLAAVVSILQYGHHDCKPVIPYPIADNAKAIMRLYGYKD